MITVNSSPVLGAYQVQCAPTLRAPYACNRNAKHACVPITCAAGKSCLQAAACGLAGACIAMIPTTAAAYNVRLEDVENENLQSGVQGKSSEKYYCRTGAHNCTIQRQHILFNAADCFTSFPVSICTDVGKDVAASNTCWCHAGVLAATEHRWDDAEKQFRIVLEQEPDSASAWSNLGNVHLSKGRPQEAFADFTEAIRLAPTVSHHLNYNRSKQRTPC